MNFDVNLENQRRNNNYRMMDGIILSVDRD